MPTNDQQKERLRKLLRHACQGKENAMKSVVIYGLISGDYIVPAKAQSQTRGLRELINQLRTEPAGPDKLRIMSGAPGYWLADTDEEYQAQIDKQLATAKRMYLTAKRASLLIYDDSEQLNIELTPQPQPGA